MAPPPPQQQQQQQQPLPQLLVVRSSSMVQINLSPLTPTAGTSTTDFGTIVVSPVQVQQNQQQQQQQQQVQQEQQQEQQERRLKGVKRIRQKLSPALLYVVSTAQFFDIVNGASVTVAILPIAQELNFTMTQVLWILNAYTISFAGLLLLSGRLGDLFGHRRMFMFGLFWFALWALVVSFSTNPIMFILSRALQGIGAANTIPSAMAFIATNYPAGPERTKAFAIFGAFGGLGAITGILLGGGLIASIGWQWIFRISAMAAFLLWVLSYFVIPVVVPNPEERPPKVDFLGDFTATVGVTAIVYYTARQNCSHV